MPILRSMEVFNCSAPCKLGAGVHVSKVHVKLGLRAQRGHLHIRACFRDRDVSQPLHQLRLHWDMSHGHRRSAQGTEGLQRPLEAST